jgi:cell fate regulator YaaT (PSP1 superfamily)
MSDQHYLVECHPLMRVVATAAVGLEIKTGEYVVLRFKGCEDIGQVRGFTDDPQAKAIAIRKVTEEDLAKSQESKKWEKEAKASFLKLLEKHELPMKVVDVHAWVDKNKIAFYFLSDRRLDFRKLHKEIGMLLGCRVVIKQIGIRDHARLIGGLGLCGRPLCCKAFLTELRPISLRTARRQNLYVNPEKISGMCGRLLCCLRFEDEAYSLSRLGKEKDSKSETPDEEWEDEGFTNYDEEDDSQ